MHKVNFVLCTTDPGDTVENNQGVGKEVKVKGSKRGEM